MKTLEIESVALNRSLSSRMRSLRVFSRSGVTATETFHRYEVFAIIEEIERMRL
jgi:hypothetical protein